MHWSRIENSDELKEHQSFAKHGILARNILQDETLLHETGVGEVFGFVCFSSIHNVCGEKGVE